MQRKDWATFDMMSPKKSKTATTFPRVSPIKKPSPVVAPPRQSPSAQKQSKSAPQTQQISKPEFKSMVGSFQDAKVAEASITTTAAAPSVARTAATPTTFTTLVSPLPIHYFDDSLMSCLCLVPLLVNLKTCAVKATCYWPSLVFQNLEQAKLWHQKLYPNQKSLHERITNKFVCAALAGAHDQKRSVVLPLGNSKGCCPKDLCKRPLIDSVDISSDDDWKTIFKPKYEGKYEGGHKVIQAWKNFNELNQHLVELRQKIPTIGPNLEQALMELERLANLEDHEDSDSENDETTPFVPSLTRPSEKEPHSILFPKPTQTTAKAKRKKTSTPASAGSTRFPVSAQKPQFTETATTTMVKAQTTASELTNNQGHVGFQAWKSPEMQPTKRARREVAAAATTDTRTPKATKRPASTDTRTPKATKRPSSPSSSVSSTTSSRKRPTVIDSGGRIEVSAWSDIKPLLKKLGHVFYEIEQVWNNEATVRQFYCLPNGDPEKHPTAVLGRNYFHSMEAYRAHLCANGVEYYGRNGKPPLSEDDLELIAYWVRFSVFTQRVTGGRKKEIIPDLEFTGSKGLQIRILRKIGYKYSSKSVLEGYLVPENNTQHLSETELWQHLGKHGLSPLCDLSQLTMEEQIALEIQIIRKYHGNYGDQAFRCIRKLKGQTKRKALSPMAVPECTPAANKDALQECTRGPSSGHHESRIMSPRKLMIEDTTPKAPWRSPRRSLRDESQSDQKQIEESVPQNTMPSPITKEETSQKPKIEATTDSSESDDQNTENKTSTKSSDANLETSVAPTKKAFKAEPVAVEETIIEEVDIPGESNDDKLSACLQFLRKDEIVAYGNLANCMGEIRRFADTVIETKGRFRDGNRPPILYICGRPGTGKTMSTTKLCKAAIDAKIAGQEEWEKSPRMCHISVPGVIMNAKYQDGMKKIMDRLEMKANQLKRSSNDEKSAAIILILDEIDQLLGKKGTESILQQLCTWAKDENNVLSIIGISNAVGTNDKTKRMREFGMGDRSSTLVFQAYKKADLVKMSQAKIGFTVVHQRAHEFIAAKVANSSGDARQYLDLVQKAIIYCRRKMKLEQRAATHTKPCVTIRDAMMAIRETNQKCKETIQSLTSYEKMTLCAGVHLARKLGGKPVQLGKLRKLVMYAFGMEADVSLEEFKGIIERLVDNGLLQLQEREKNAFTSTAMFNLLHYPVQFDLQLEDVDSALEDTLMKEDFYKRMVDKIQAISGL